MLTSWEICFREGVDEFRSSNYKDALEHFDEAIKHGGERHSVYDSRAAVYEKLGDIKYALRDSKKVIQLAPHLRHGYARSARLFLRLGKHESALEMARLALDRVKRDDVVHHVELEELRQAILEARDAPLTFEARNRAHILKLPVELLAEIFTLATQMDIAAPARVALICSHWRSIVLSIPALWRFLAISNRQPVRKVVLWLARSKNNITGLRIRASISRLQLHDTLAVYGPNFSKLKSIHCEVDIVLLSSILMNILPNVLDLDLDDIHLSCRRAAFGHLTFADLLVPLGPLIPLTRPSNARTLVLEYITVDWSVVVPQLSHLRTLVIRTTEGFPERRHVFSLLESNPHLEQMVLETEYAAWDEVIADEVARNERIELPALSHLELIGPFEAYRIISHISLPVIKNVVISRSCSAADKVLLALYPSYPRLTELSIHTCSFTAAPLASFLRQMFALTTLGITHTRDPVNAIIDALAGSTPTGEVELACPLLQHVDFSHCCNLLGGAIMRLVKPRLVDPTDATSSQALPPPAKLKTIRIDGCPRVDPAVPEWLKGRVDKVSCVYMTKAEVKKMRRPFSESKHRAQRLLIALIASVKTKSNSKFAKSQQGP